MTLEAQVLLSAGRQSGEEYVIVADYLFSCHIKLTIQFALPQTRRNVDARDLTVTVSSGAKRTVVPVSGGTPAPSPRAKPLPPVLIATCLEYLSSSIFVEYVT